MSTNITVTIARQFGSGGHEIGEVLAKKLDVPFYDKELIKLAAEKSGMSHEVLANMDEHATSSFLYSLSMGYGLGSTGVAAPMELPLTDKLFLLQTDIIKKVAAAGGAVIVGRCADYILRENTHCINVYIHSGLENRIDRISKLYNITPVKAEELIIKTDKKRAAYYSFYSGSKWGVAEHYDLCMDSSAGVENCAQLIAELVKMKEENK